MKYFIKLFLICFIGLMGTELIFKYFSFDIFDISLIRITLFTFTTSFLIAYIASFFGENVSRTIILSFNFLMTLYALIQLSFKGFMGNFMSFGMLKDGDVGRIHNEVLTFIKSINPYHLLIFIPLVLMLLFLIFYKNLEYSKRTWKINSALIALFIFFYSGSLLSLEIKCLDDPLQVKTTKQLYYNPSLLDISLRNLGTTKFLFRDFINIFKDSSSEVVEIEKPVWNEPIIDEPDYTRFFDDSDWIDKINSENDKIIKNIDEFYINRSITPKNEYTGLFKDKNLILIMVEALDMSAIDPNLTPTLYRLTNEGWYFDNYYAPKYSCTTGESEFIALTSIVPSNATCTPYAYANNEYDISIFNLFNKSDYKSTSYHSWSDQYYPRTTLHKNMGSVFYNADKLGIGTNLGWPSDVLLMEKAYEVFKQDDKFFSFIITVSMHFSYDFDDAIVRKNWSYVKDVDTGISMKRYLAKAIEFDRSLEYLLNTLENDGTLDDTVIAIFGDHHPYNLDFKYLANRSFKDRYQDLNEDLMPFIIYNRNIEPLTISKTASTFDILPTLANLFDLDYDPRYYVGSDIFSDEDTRVIFPNGSWVSDNAVYFASSGKYKLKTDVTKEYISKMNADVSNWFTISNNTLKRNYFKYR